MLLENKRVVLGICGGIAAFKAAHIASLLRQRGAEVKCIMTEHATKLITPLTMREISGNPVAVSMFGDTPEFNVEHIALARWADIFVIAPATANILGKVACGIADDMLSTTIMATKAPVLFVPAMNSNMYLNPVVQDNMARLKRFGYEIMEPASGHLACGIIGIGRLPEPEEIVDRIELTVCRTNTLAGKKVIVTAGGTREPIDPVRFIGNHSSGRMGFALAKAAVLAGADVTLIAGSNDHLETPPGVSRRIDVGSTRDMKAAVDAYYDDCDLVIKAAAVADYRSAAPAKNKIKKNDDVLNLKLEKNPDILYGLGQRKTHQVLIGFAAETTNVIEYGTAKLKKKNLDMLVANDVSAKGAGFQGTTNIGTLLYADGRVEKLEKMSKFALAEIIVDRAAKIIAAKQEGKD
ncbi:MAG: bifunctional phosphopantothenoylcysteine decarboxylase/phosphopantothenate--cysteine ligase CoaBC [Caecibacter massiliensis]|jgi:phosphopantothenoylcysteine decarboxylase/phosphopantothenate--cysteine ligase|uniref:Coenzyme A biosynthesis bifunctional protein CoaBC n=1 Tax=Megasphaera hexanoica TaxID=1675036 RepID=A0A848BYX6_9FIRM|nr:MULTISPECIES: bifunctional phosphopantothenoylcysteine decarboxylase/phosphopantothenate--cysteine ligase CoaBC [Megasphaera]MCI5532950.1 bifunctional phosphopantothenoylcysteine decarboxylase/phosphopantothenate--cysteine ligase CoaBC [Caecibacter massiliensis]NME28219.1 bifunctional phosphopantothenoylcysteine decarboxylase/phosphopantothenate--cysteine ligase CoaBC [Megasphaera hexanoica]